MLPTDSELQRKQKKKKVKALKQAHKLKIIDKQNKEKQDTWLNFRQTKKAGSSIFQTSESS